MAQSRDAAESDWDLREWLRRAREGDDAAFEAIVLRYERAVLRLALRLCAGSASAEDVAQEVLIRLHRCLGQFDGERDLWPWLCRVTVNLCRDEARSSSKWLSISGRDIPGESDDPERAARLNQWERHVGEGLKRLSETERSSLVLRAVEGLTTAEIARRLGSAEPTVRSHICRARIKLRKYLQALGKRRR